ncbi:MAG: adenosylmethionine-8-amino-7-oxononanoate aminotransferase [Planctomycetaceae bacterium]|nr:MAG: adenosylmethionine-8-amino-7-oxononanoate aminotransferase [Planctomycetaceae bacterium]
MCDASQLRQWDLDHVWHPFTQMAVYRIEEAPIIVGAEGFFLIDASGRKYLDGHSSLWCNIHGHRVPELDTALHQQLQRVSHSTLLGLANEPSILLARELVRRAPPGLNKVFYADCGAAGVEVALKLAWQYHRQKPRPEPRDLFACLAAAYHGDTVGTVSLGGIELFHSLFAGLTFPVLRLPHPCQPGGSLSECLEQTEELIAQHANRLVAVVVEPLVQAAAGIVVHPPGYLHGLRAITSRHRILLIADEIAVAFGRVGSLWACSQENVIPDMLVLSKGLTAGYLPLAATLVTDEIYEAFLGQPWEQRTFYHGHTYTGNPLACAVALASLNRLETHGVLENAKQLEALLHRELVCPLMSQPATFHVQAVRHRGTMVGIELAETNPRDQLGHRATLACRELGVIVRNIGAVLVVMPAPAMPLELAHQLCQVVLQALQQLT